MRRPQSLAAVLAFGLLVGASAAGERPLRAAHSENGRFRLRIHPGRPGGGESRRCRATLFDAEHARPRRVWTEKLANDVAPGQALIRNDGRFVVTLDEYRRGGGAHAVVIYGERGQPLREFGLRELLGGKDWQHVRVRKRAIEWLPGATFAFVDQPAQFVIQLKWGREIRIDLDKLAIAKRSEDDRQDTGKTEQRDATEPTDQIPPEMLALLAETTSAPSAPAETAVEFSEQAVQHALEELRWLAEASGVELPADTDQQAEPGQRAAWTAPSHESTHDRLGPLQTPEADELRFAGNSAAAGLPVPAPDPADPVDYLAWLTAQTETAGPSAEPLYEAAFAAHVPWEGDRALYQAALAGDPQALGAPEMGAWLESNREALDYWHAATDLEYRSTLIPGDDGSLIGVMLPKLGQARELARAAIIQAKWLETQGETDAALVTYADTLAVGAQVGQGPTLIENLVGMTIQALTAKSLLNSMTSAAGERVDYLRLAEQLKESYTPLRPLAEVFQVERAMVLDFIQRAYEWDAAAGCYRVAPERLTDVLTVTGGAGARSELAALTLGFVFGQIGFERMVAQVNEHYDALTEAAAMPYEQAQRTIRQIEQRAGSGAFRLQNPALSVLLPSIRRAHHLAVRAATLRSATRLITNLKAYRQQHGAYPDSLEVFGHSDMVIDPFTGEHFVYHRLGDDFRLYSLGANGVDDGGVHDRRGDAGDLVFWPRPEED